jgi:DegV family protein with EDD domain
MAVKIITDSTADIPEDLLKKYGIEIVPLTVNFEDRSYLDKIEISSLEFFDKLVKVDKLPTTSQASPGILVEAFEKELEKGNEIVSIHVSSKFSGTFGSAIIAKEMVGSDKIYLVDSESACAGHCILVLEAAKLANEGLSASEIIIKLDAIKSKISIYAGIDTLKYLEKSGRLSKGVAVVGTMLNIKPIIRVKNSKIESIDKVRGKAKVFKWLDDFIDSSVKPQNKTVAVYYSVNKEIAIELKKLLIEKHNAKDVFIGEIGPVIGTHVGPNALAIAFIED